ncbi:MAG: glycosyl hydrolase family 95 catalytic domain-containing protein [Muribaculaceae bacterium]
MYRIDLCKFFFAVSFIVALSFSAGAKSASCKLGKMHHSDSDLVFDSLAISWDEGVPLGNAVVGELVWRRADALRLSIDRTDLWDLRPVDSLSGNNYKFEWVKQHIRQRDYLPVQKKFDHPYDREPAPSRLPGAAVEFSLSQLGKPDGVHLFLNNALCEVTWKGGARMQTFVHAIEPVGWFVFENVDADIEPQLVIPTYQNTEAGGQGNTVSGHGLQRLGYKQGVVERQSGCITYHQPGYGDYSYDVAVRWKRDGRKIYGCWSITSSLVKEHALKITEQAMERGVKRDFARHMQYWRQYWAQSWVKLPDQLLQKQYDNEMYKFGSASREHSYPISLQAVWTADNGNLPPWKGDYHHDLNTQLSYWPAYTSNHLSEGLGYINTLWKQRDVYKRYTRQYFGTDGMNVPGVCTLTGEPMGGWIQYAMSQTVGAWLAQHFYLHWKYSADMEFLRQRAYPFIRDVATYMEQQSFVDSNGVRSLEFSSSPEIFDNSLQAWFLNVTNFDLSLMHFIFSAASECALAVGDGEASQHWRKLQSELPDYDVDAQGALTFAKGFEYNGSHRHFSHALAIHPLGLIDVSKGEKHRRIIDATLQKLEQYGGDYWTGYSYAWYGNMQARALNGEKAAQALRTFAECFCLPNTFHVNGDQSGTGKSKFTYRPFTLEGNFAFASGIQEMLLQSHTGIIRVFPAIPQEWNDVSFDNLRAMGAFLVSAERRAGKVVKLKVHCEKGGVLRIASPVNGQVLEYSTKPGEVVDVL